MIGMLFQRIASIRQIVASVRERMPHILDRQRQFLSDKLEELKAGLDPIRLEQEITLLAQKADVDEELDRLASHLNEVERVIEITGQKGRRLAQRRRAHCNRRSWPRGAGLRPRYGPLR